MRHEPLPQDVNDHKGVPVLLGDILPKRCHLSPRYVYLIFSGLVLGLMSFAGDVTPGVGGRIITAVFSTGSAWCALSVVAGYQYQRRLHSSTAAVGLLLVAVFAYYGVTALSGVRFGSYVRQGNSGSALSQANLATELESFVRGVGFWAAASVAVGIIMGLLGYYVRNGSGKLPTVATGILFGIVSGPSMNSLVFILRFGANVTTSQLVLPATCGLLVAFLILAWITTVKRSQIIWPLLAAVSALSCFNVALLCNAVEAVRMRL